MNNVMKMEGKQALSWVDVGKSCMWTMPARFEDIGVSSINNSYAYLLGPIDLSMISARNENSPVAK